MRALPRSKKKQNKTDGSAAGVGLNEMPPYSWVFEFLLSRWYCCLLRLGRCSILEELCHWHPTVQLKASHRPRLNFLLFLLATGDVCHQLFPPPWLPTAVFPHQHSKWLVSSTTGSYHSYTEHPRAVAIACVVLGASGVFLTHNS